MYLLSLQQCTNLIICVYLRPHVFCGRQWREKVLWIH